MELPLTSACSDFQSSPAADGCWAPARFRRAVLLVLDGLRWDVAAGEARSAVPGRALALPRLAELARTSGVLFPFVADPPTTTQQRLKALLTGSLPTFLDAGASFGAPALLEDNLVAQAAAAGRKLAVLGDDTWLQLFPHPPGNGSASTSVWSVAHPFPSFNVRDLHTCDSGVAAQLPPLLAQPGRWDLLIAHFLGVDHAGHSHGVDSPEMASKLAEMDALAVSVFSQLASDPVAHADTLFLVIGDHGMTWAGDHGGASAPEVTSALFAAAPGRPSRGQVDETATAAAPMPQLDFAATLSLLLGLPVPFASMGRLDRRLWELGGGGEGFDAALAANAAQVLRALRAYEAAGALPSQEVRRVAAAAEAAEEEGLSPEGMRLRLSFLADAAALARAEWTKFGTAAMAAGLAGLALCLLLHAHALRSAPAPPAAAGAPPSPFAAVAALSLLAILAHATGSFSVGCMKAEAEFGHLPSLAVGALHALTALLARRASPPLGARALLPPLALPLLSVALFALRMHGEDKPAAASRPPLLAALSTAAPLLLIPALLLRSRRGLGPALAWGAHVAAALRPFLSPSGAPARLLLPRLVYALGGAALLAAPFTRTAGAHVAGERSRRALAALSAPLLLLSGRSAPLLALLALAQTSALLRIHRPRPGHATWRLLSLACGLHATTLALFHASGHRSSFDSLHFSASFTGFDSFTYATQGALLAANTWAAELAAAAALPLVAAIAAGGEPARRGAFGETLAALALTRTALRCVGAAAAAGAAAALRRHLHVWSHFAPHFVFSSLALLLMDGLTLLAVSLLAEPEQIKAD